MITKTHLLDSMLHECTVAQHLYSKFSSDGFDFRPTPEQRNTLELLRYLAFIGIAGVTCIADRDWKKFGDFRARTAEMRPTEFIAAMDRQKAELIAWFKAMPDEKLATQEGLLPGGSSMPLAAALMNGPVKWLTAYKLQLFLYAKSAGAKGLSTVNAWAGVDKR